MNENDNDTLNKIKLKLFRTVAIILFCAGLIFGTQSCAVYVKRSNGNHHGWYKNPHNPHNPISTNPGHP